MLAAAQSDYRPELKLKMKNVVSVIIINKISVRQRRVVVRREGASNAQERGAGVKTAVLQLRGDTNPAL